MTIRTLRRRVIIREYDYRRVCSEIKNQNNYHSELYDRYEFTPLSAEVLEKLKLYELLRGHDSVLTKINPTLANPSLLLYKLKDLLYDQRYVHWKVSVDEDGFLCIQSRKNTPNTRLGWAVFEKDLKSRL